jgi:hypothetical protein
MDNIQEDKFMEAFGHIFGDFHPNKGDLVNIKSVAQVGTVQLEIDDFMDLIESSVRAFEEEALNIKPIHIANVDTFMADYKRSFFRTQESMEMVRKEVKYVKRIKKGLKIDIRRLMAEFKQKQRLNAKNIRIKKMKVKAKIESKKK